MKERVLSTFAILLAGLFSAERPKPWQLGDSTPSPKSPAPGEGHRDPKGEQN